MLSVVEFLKSLKIYFLAFAFTTLPPLNRRAEIEEFISECGDVKRVQKQLENESRSLSKQIKSIDGRIKTVIRNRGNIPNKFQQLHNKEQSRFEEPRNGIREAEEEREFTFKRNRKAYDCFVDGTYKSWF